MYVLLPEILQKHLITSVTFIKKTGMTGSFLIRFFDDIRNEKYQPETQIKKYYNCFCTSGNSNFNDWAFLEWQFFQSIAAPKRLGYGE